MPGYWKRETEDPSCFDHEGFYRIGDAVRPVDPDQPALGLYFDGRIAEDFKLTSGTWVDVGRLRLRALSALSPIAQDVVVTGHDRDEVGLLIFPNVSDCRTMCGDLDPEAPLEEILRHSAVGSRVREGLRELKAAGTGSSTYPVRALLLDTPPAIDAGEITDKGYINQRAVLERRRALVEHLYRSARLAHPVVFLIGEA
jgi:feruloyl-CoA synthase